MRKQLRRLRRLLFPALRRPDQVPPAENEAALELMYGFIFGRPIDEEGRRHYLRLLGEGMKLREIGAQMASSDEFQRRLHTVLEPPPVEEPAAPPPRDGFVDSQELMNTQSVEALAATAEDYYRSTLAFTDRYLSKPLDDPHSAPDLLGSFAQLLGGLRLAPGMTVLDFGAGMCWTSRFLAQLGCRVIATDVSQTALELGAQLFERLPPIGSQPAPRFLLFDGRRLDLPDACVDRIVCFDAFHHVANPADVMREFGRVLRPGGIAAFSEPGPQHSKAAWSQYEMKNYAVLERDIVMQDVWQWAKAAGFAQLELAIFNTDSRRVSLKEFDDLVAGGRALYTYGLQLRGFLSGHRTFFLTRAGEAMKDSRHRDGLRAELSVHLESTSVRAAGKLRGRVTALNTGEAWWLPGSVGVGGVHLGVHLRSGDGRPLSLDFARAALPHEVAPGRSHTFDVELTPPQPGNYLLDFDLVAEGVGWFEMSGSATATVAVAVAQG